jgi:hypothetical protein
VKNYPVLNLKRRDHERLKELQLQIKVVLIEAYEAPSKVYLRVVKVNFIVMEKHLRVSVPSWYDVDVKTLVVES